MTDQFVNAIMKSILLSVFILFLSDLFSQEEYNVSGYIIDYNTGESLIGSNVYNETSKTGSVSNSYGYFSVNIPGGQSVIKCSYVGYKTDSLIINVKSDINHNFRLFPSVNNLDEVILKGEDLNIKSIQNSVINLPVKKVKNIFRHDKY